MTPCSRLLPDRAVLREAYEHTHTNADCFTALAINDAMTSGTGAHTTAAALGAPYVNVWSCLRFAAASSIIMRS